MQIDWLKLFSDAKAALMRRGRTEAAAEDFLQDAYLRVTVYAEENHVENLHGLFMRTAMNISIDHHRERESRGEAEQLENVVLVCPRPGVEEAVLSREQSRRLEVCMSRLSDRTRQMVYEHRMEGLSYEQIAARHKLHISTVQQIISRAMFKVSGWMQGWYP
jgi:RNA polymerase sigma factor (sigma-70 family)